MWCGPTQPVPYNKDLYTPRARPGWISFRPYSGGEMTGWGSHGLDQVQWALGMDNSGPIEIWTEGPKFDPPTYDKPEGRGRGEKICRVPTIYYRYAGDIVMELTRGPAGGGIFVGEKGTITINRGRCKSDPPEIAKEPIKDGDVRLYESNNHKGNWAECIRSRKLPVADVEIGHRSATVCHLGNIARWLSGRKLQWDPEKEQFVGDDEANQLLDRERRKPWTID
jgi:predicted dehydrogenase